MLNGFYTTVDRKANQICYRGYDIDGAKVYEKFKFRPTLYVESKKKDTKWKALDGTPLDPIQFDSMSACREFMKQYEDISSFRIHGNDRHIPAFIQAEFPGEIKYKKHLIDVLNLDIETATSGNSFPDPTVAEEAITAIGIKSFKSDTYIVWGTKFYNPKKSLVPHLKKEFRQFDTENEMLLDFIEWWSDLMNCPDVVTGWNIRTFDIPYIINRVAKVLDNHEVKRLSPWGEIQQKTVRNNKGGEDLCFDISGIQQLDYLELFKKFTLNTYGQQESYRLNSIAEVVLGENKIHAGDEDYPMHKFLESSDCVSVPNDKKDEDLEEFEKWCRFKDRIKSRIKVRKPINPGVYNDIPFENLTDSYLDALSQDQLNHLCDPVQAKADQLCYNIGIDYNLVDIELVEKIDAKVGLLDLVFTLAYFGGVNYTETLGTVGIWDSIIFRKLATQHIAIPPNKRSFKSDYAGGYVKDPIVGRHEWVTSFDLNSLYPMLIVQYNMSPETIVKHMKVPGIDPELMLANPSKERWNPEDGLAMAINGACFRTDKQGVIPSIIEDLYNQRKEIKKKMLAAESEKEITPKDSPRYKELETEIDLASNKQMCLKICLNSLYGATGNVYFRYYDLDIAEGITLSGQFVIQSVERSLNEFLSTALKDDPKKPKDRITCSDTDSVYVSLEDVVKKCKPEDPHKFCIEFAKAALEPVIEKTYADLAKKTNAFKNTMAMKLEKISEAAIFIAKKRYILKVLSSEGVEYKEPKFTIKGIEANKSSTPKICRDEFKRIFHTIIDKTSKDVQREVEEFREVFYNQPVEKIAQPKSVSNIKKYMQSGPVPYIKGTPINSRAAIMYNKLLKEKGLTGQYETLKNGDRLKYIMLKKGNPTGENVIAFPSKMPKEFELHSWIDYDLLYQKTYLDPLQLILTAIGQTAVSRPSLEDFFD